MKIDISKLCFYFCLQYALIITFHNFHLSFLKILKSTLYGLFRSSHPKVFLEKDVLKICSKFTGEHPRQSLISPFLKNTSGRLLLAFTRQVVPVTFYNSKTRDYPFPIVRQFLYSSF